MEVQMEGSVALGMKRAWCARQLYVYLVLNRNWNDNGLLRGQPNAFYYSRQPRMLLLKDPYFALHGVIA